MTAPNDTHSIGERRVEAFLEHFGVRGMKWGQRKDRSSGSGGGVGGTSTHVHTAPGKISVSGGHHRMPSEDAVRAAELHAIANASTHHALSNKELRTLVDRMNLEQQFHKVVIGPHKETPQGKAVGWVSSKLSTVGNMFVDTAIKIKVTEQVNEIMGVEHKKAQRAIAIAKATKAASGG